MKFLEVKSLQIEAIKVIKFAHFCDQRGYLTEHYHRSDLTYGSGMDFFSSLLHAGQPTILFFILIGLCGAMPF
jgi:dTDP-4-dehydrorhamnose 3,5-epimerase-like enzyme